MSELQRTYPVTDFSNRLRAVTRSHYGGQVVVKNLRPMQGGHAGLTFGFDVCDRSTRPLDSLILKMSPPGVRRDGAADVFRQARLLQALHGAQVPVPALRWAENDEEPLGSPYIVMQRVPGKECFNLDPANWRANDDIKKRIWSLAISTLGELAKFDWQTHLSGWQRAIPLQEEFSCWERTLRKSPNPDWIDMGLRARDALASALPGGEPVRLVHGDFQPSNLMIHHGKVAGIIDWDLSTIGSGMVDLGWSLLFADRRFWGPHWTGWFAPSIADLERQYLEVTGEDGSNVRWYRAYAAYRFGAIACLNVKLHREGRRIDPVWEKLALDIPRLFERAVVMANSSC